MVTLPSIFYPGGFIFIAYPKWSEQWGRINKDRWHQPPVNLTSELLSSSMVVEMVPLTGGIGSIQPPNEGKDYKWYDIPANWGMDYATDPTC